MPTTVFQAQSFIELYLLSNKPPASDGVYPSHRGFFRGCEINLKRKSKVSGAWTANVKAGHAKASVTASSKLLAMQLLLDELTELGI